MIYGLGGGREGRERVGPVGKREGRTAEPIGRVGGVLLDVSGVLYVGETAVPGAREALARLERAALPYRLVSNVSRQPAERLLRRLRGLGFAIEGERLFTAPRAARDYLLRHGLRPHLLVHPDLRTELADLEAKEPNAVLLGDAGDALCYASLNAAFRLMMDGAPLLALGDNRYFREADGLSLDIGPFARALEYATATDAIVLGKPAPEFFHAAVASTGGEPDRCVMIGDDVHTDVAGAIAAGLGAILVRTGKFRDGDERHARSLGAEVVEDLSAAIDRLLASAPD